MVYYGGIFHISPCNPSGHTGEVNQLRVNIPRTKLASCSDDKTARIWNIQDIVYGREPDDRVMTLAGHKGQVSNLVWQPCTAELEHELLVTSVCIPCRKCIMLTPCAMQIILRPLCKAVGHRYGPMSSSVQ